MNQCDNPLGADNQQGRSIPSPEFIAGLITGEGSYFIGARRYRGYIQLYPGFGLRMNDVETIELVYRFFDAHDLWYLRKTPYKNCVGLDANGTRVMRKHLDFFLPLLTGKKLCAAEIVSEFTDSRIANHNKRYTEHEIDLLARLREVNGPSRARVPIETLRDYTLRPQLRGKI